MRYNTRHITPAEVAEMQKAPDTPGPTAGHRGFAVYVIDLEKGYMVYEGKVDRASLAAYHRIIVPADAPVAVND